MTAAPIELASPELIAKYEPVIGLEVHCQLATRTKNILRLPGGLRCVAKIRTFVRFALRFPARFRAESRGCRARAQSRGLR